MSLFQIHNIGTERGDCFIIQLTKRKKAISSENVYDKITIMVDGHTGKNQISDGLDKYETIDYLIVTHVDDDHIHGLIDVIDKEPFKKKFENTIVVYNMIIKPLISYRQANAFEDKLLQLSCKNIAYSYWDNYDVYQKSFLRIYSHKLREEFDVSSEYAYITFLNPMKTGVESMRNDFKKKFLRAGCIFDKTVKYDPRLVNKYSIVFLLEYNNISVLFTGDSTFSDYDFYFSRFKNFESKDIDLIKLCHHGSFANNKGIIHFATSKKCKKYLVTGPTNWDKKHPAISLLQDVNKQNNEPVTFYSKINIDPNALGKIKLSNQEIIELDK